VTDRQAAAGFCLLLVAFTAYLCFKGIAWVVRNGWRSMLGLVALRGEAVVSFDDHADEALALLRTHEAIPDAVEIGQPVMWMALETQCADPQRPGRAARGACLVNLFRWWRQARHIRNLTVRLNAKAEELYAAHRRIAALTEGRYEDADLRAADARISDLTDQLAEAGRANRSAHDQITGLQKQLAEYAIANVATHRIADLHHLVSVLPPALNRDRSNVNALAAENAQLRAEVERLQIALKEGPS
jgi:hypothetical protein